MIKRKPSQVTAQNKHSPVRFILDQERVKGSILYLLSNKVPNLTQLKLGRLLFLADKHHLVQYGLPITGDEYHAIESGPIPFNITIMLNQVESSIKSPLDGLFDLDRSFLYPRYVIKPSINFKIPDALSQFDVKTLDLIIWEYKYCSYAEINNVTRSMPAYTKAWKRANDRCQSVRMNFEDFFEGDDDALKGIFELVVETGRQQKFLERG